MPEASYLLKESEILNAQVLPSHNIEVSDTPGFHIGTDDNDNIDYKGI